MSAVIFLHIFLFPSTGGRALFAGVGKSRSQSDLLVNINGHSVVMQAQNYAGVFKLDGDS